MITTRYTKILVALTLGSITPTSWATNAQFQDFFSAACANPMGGLASRCAETENGLGDISGDSESSLNPSQTLSSADAAIFAAEQRSRDIRDRLDAQRDPETDGVSESPTVDLGPFSLLINARSTSADSDRTIDLDSERGYELDQHAAELGFDYRVNDSLVWGAWLQWGRAELDFDAEISGVNFAPANRAGDIETDSLGITAFMSAQISEKAYLDASIGYTKIDVAARRNSIFQESNRVLTQVNSLTSSDTEGTELLLTLTGGYQQTLGAWQLNSYLGVNFVDTALDDYRETDVSGAGLALDVALADQSVLFAQAGINASTAISMAGWIMVPQVRVEYLHELSRDRSKTRVRFLNDAGNNNYRLRGDDFDENRVTFAAGLFGIFPNGWIPFLEYHTTVSANDFSRRQISAGLRIEL